MGNWIKTTEKLPPLAKNVLVCVLDTVKKIRIGFFAPAYTLIADSYIDISSFYDEEDYATYTDYDENKKEYFLKEGWFIEMGEDQQGCLSIFDKKDVTHWQSLPEIPN